MLLYPFQCLLTAAFIASLPVVSSASGSVCSQGLYKDLLILSAFAPAEKYCSSNYPLATTTITVTAPAQQKRAATTPSTKTTTTKSTSTSTALAAMLATAQAKGKSFISTLCSCIETRPSTTVTVTPAPTCNPSVQLQGLGGGCFFNVFCDTTFVPAASNSGLDPIVSTQDSLQGCVEQCDKDFKPNSGVPYTYCRAFNYYSTRTTNNCVIFDEEVLGIAFYSITQSTPGVINGMTVAAGQCKGI